MVYQAYLQLVEVDLLQRGDGVGVAAFDGPQLLVAAAVGVGCLRPAPLRQVGHRRPFATSPTTRISVARRP